MEGLDYANLRFTLACMLRFAMNAARRLPRVHGISTVDCSAVAMTDLIKRLFMFSLVSLLLVCLLGRLPLVEHLIDRSMGRVLGSNDKK